MKRLTTIVAGAVVTCMLFACGGKSEEKKAEPQQDQNPMTSNQNQPQSAAPAPTNNTTPAP